MTLSQSALLEVLDALKASDSTDVIRNARQVMLQHLIDADGGIRSSPQAERLATITALARAALTPRVIVTESGSPGGTLGRNRWGRCLHKLGDGASSAQAGRYPLVLGLPQHRNPA